MSVWLGTGFILLGMVANIVGALRFASARRAILEGKAIPAGGLSALSLAAALTVLAGILAAYVLIS